MRRIRYAIVAFTALSGLVIAGCAVRPVMPEARGGESGGQACRRYFQELDERMRAAGVTDAGAARVSGFPYLRVDRFLASFRMQVTAEPGFTAWVDRLERLDAQGRRIELANLPLLDRASLPRPPATMIGLNSGIAACADILRHADLRTPAGRTRLRETARVPDDYHTIWRVLGLYPLTAPFVSMGIARWHEEAHHTFALPLDTLPHAGKLVRYTPPPGVRLTPSEVAAILRRAATNPLGIPEPTASERTLLFDAFAPVWEVDTVDRNDRIGTPLWRPPAALVKVDTNHPTVFRRLSHTRFAGRTLLQLNYVIWFPARPLTGAFDLYGGHLDGINWRVTLDIDGRPLLYDAIHNCGCYHMFFPTERLRLRTDFPSIYFEPPLVPESLRAELRGSRTIVRIAHHTHYLQRVTLSLDSVGDGRYAFDDYDHLRSLPLPQGGWRSMFSPSGIVPGTGRAERWVLWPMGIAEPGAMRQWGHHAVAFVGRRHFDDPDLLEQLFEPTSTAEAYP